MNSTVPYQTIELECLGQSSHVRYVDAGEGIPYLFLHGWGTGAFTFFPIMEILAAQARVIALDFPGFGESTLPQDVWGTPEYAEFVFAFAKKMKIEECHIVSHSFGGRVSMRMAVSKPELIKSMVLIAAAGIKRKQPFFKKIKIKTIQTIAKTAAQLFPGVIGQKIKHKLYSLIASADYQQAGLMKNIFVRVVNEDMKDLLQNIHTRSLLLYGSDDDTTPPQVGQMIADGLPRSRYIELPGFDHNSILERGRHQVCHHIQSWMNELKQGDSA